MDIFTDPVASAFLDSQFLSPDYLADRGGNALYNIFYLIFFSSISRGVLMFFALFFLSIIAYTSVRMLEIRRKEARHLEHKIREYAHHKAEQEKKKEEGEGMSKNEKWNNLLIHLMSSSPGDWKLAVIEADLLLDVLLYQLGFQGKTVGERLKSADQEKFPQLTQAWEVHTIRNRIAHEGLNFELSLHEARRVIAIYESIFRPYGLI